MSLQFYRTVVFDTEIIYRDIVKPKQDTHYGY